MVDYSVDDSFDIHFTEHGDIAEVDSYEEFEENILIRIHFALQEYIGGTRQTETIRERVELLVTRTAREEGIIDSIKRISVTEAGTATDTLTVEISYDTVRNFEETI